MTGIFDRPRPRTGIDDENGLLFVAILALLGVVGFVVEAIALPPDPVTQVLFVGPWTLTAALLAYWLSYRDGLDRLLAPRS